MMGEKIHSKALGINRCYLIEGQGNILIDAGPPGTEDALLDWLRSLGFSPDSIGLIILTHGHADHVGSAAALKRATGASVAVHRWDREWVEKGVLAWPTPASVWGRVVRFLMSPVRSMLQFDGVAVDVELDDVGLALEEYGIAGRIVHTPGHTAGSVSVLLDGGETFVGCLAHNRPPFRLRPGLPIFAEDLRSLKRSWKTLLDMGARTIYPAHGDSFWADVMRQAL